MIDRYTNEKMGKIWSEENQYQKWLDIEILVCEAWADLGIIPLPALKTIKEKAAFDIDRVREIESQTHHDVIAFLTSVSEFVGPDSRYVHYGMTSSDILDTSLSVRLVEASDIILEKLKKLAQVLREGALKFKGMAIMGRSHGIHAEPTTLGLKMLLFYEEICRNIERMLQAKKEISVGMISGPVGTFSNMDPRVEKYVCDKLSLTVEPVSTQVIQRDRHAQYMTTLAVIGSSLDKFATEVRGLQKTEIREVEEYFAPGQKGSSAMPHKRNPIISERLSGLARLLRSYSIAALENVALWHERDISHSSVERVMMPDATITLDYMLGKAIDLFDKLVAYPENMQKNMSLMRGLVFSQTVMLALIEKGVTREDAYLKVQEAAMKVWANNEGKTLKDFALEGESFLQHLAEDEIKKCFDMKHLLNNEDVIYERVLDKNCC
ncbi:adenylosuccinate lyase [PVC group bacterium (ex Bugula neritina AB1)]|nr:adenylosuccinate lyase [PVC group bacterium (ex Bugula neritina AB1)]